MHGIIHVEFHKFVTERYGEEAWRTLLAETGLAQDIFTPLSSYPDEHIVALVTRATALTGRSAAELLESVAAWPRISAKRSTFKSPSACTAETRSAGSLSARSSEGRRKGLAHGDVRDRPADLEH
jgi:hypothetical protein